jgi:lysophospholipase L1-like esterase/pimeloyl-ACP methyl ester carboxylesterase
LLAVGVSLFFLSMSGADLKSAEPQDVAFVSKLDGSEQRYVVLLPEGFDPQSSVSVMIALHGHGSDRWQFVKDGRDECRAARDAAAKQRMIYVSPDYRAKTSWMGPAAEADLVQILAELRSKYRVHKAVITGGSMGGTGALTFAALHPDMVDGVVSMNGTANLVEYAQFQDAISASFGGSKQVKPNEYRKRSAELNADKLTMPIAMTTGGKDTLVPPDSVLRLAEALQRQNRLVKSIHKPDGGHDTKYGDAIEAFDFVFAQVFAAGTGSAAKPLLEFGAKPVTIVCLGDSVTGVYYHTGGRRAYPEMLEVAIKQAIPTANVRVINAGISGHSTDNGLKRLDSDVLMHKPDLVTISFGLNDMVRLSEEQYRQNLETLVARCRDAKAAVVLCTPNSVITTGGRPIEKLKRYCDVIHAVGKALSVPVCDQFAAGEAFRAKDAWGFRCLLSDEIHPNMDGHKMMAQELCHTITGQEVSLSKVGPLRPALVKTRALLESGKPVKVLAMPPFDTLIGPALKQLSPQAVVELTAWPTGEKSLAEIERFAKDSVRAAKPDLVIIAVPAGLTATTDEEFFRSYSWIMNWSLSFAHQEWDCLVVHPSVVAADRPDPRQALIRQLVKAQELTLIDRTAGDTTSAAEIFEKALKQSW